MKRLGKFVAQGAVGNAIMGYLLIISTMLFHPNVYNFLYMAALPPYLLLMGIIGAVLGGVIWLSEWLLERGLRILERAAVGIIITTLVMAVLGLWQEYIVGWRLLGGSLLSGLLLGLPAALMAGSRFNPLRSLIFGLSREASFRDFGSVLAFPPALLLRLASVFGLLESLLFLAYLASSVWVESSIDLGGESLAGTIVAILYFTASAFVSFGSPPNWLLLTMAAVANLPLTIWAWATYPFTTFAITMWVFLFLWLLLVVGRMLSTDNNPKSYYQQGRFFPLTMWEIEIRHALNRW